MQSVTQTVFIQTEQNDCSNIEDVYLLFCAPLKNYFLVLEGC